MGEGMMDGVKVVEKVGMYRYGLFAAFFVETSMHKMKTPRIG
jgi:hypothetical protein